MNHLYEFNHLSISSLRWKTRFLTFTTGRFSSRDQRWYVDSEILNSSITDFLSSIFESSFVPVIFFKILIIFLSPSITSTERIVCRTFSSVLILQFQYHHIFQSNFPWYTFHSHSLLNVWQFSTSSKSFWSFYPISSVVSSNFFFKLGVSDFSNFLLTDSIWSSK